MRHASVSCVALVVVAVIIAGTPAQGARYMEALDRGVVAVKITSGVYVGWRMLGTEPTSVAYNIYRGTTKLNTSPITASTNYLDSAGTTSSTYSVSAVIDGVEQPKSAPVSVWGTNYLTVPLSRPTGGTTPDDVTYDYSPNDASVGDLDGDGQYEIVLKWDPSNSKDNSQSGYTGNVYLDAYKIDGTFMWRIDLGVNIRAGAHYTQFMVYDLDGDGKAEVACKTAPGTKDGLGDFVIMDSDDPYADYRNTSGYILDGPEYLTVFNGQTGANMATVAYDPPRGSVSSWGDSYGNRVDRFLACVAYLDGVRPSLVMCRGYYTRAVLVAWNWRAGRLIKVWTFDSYAAGNIAYSGQGNHNLSVGDVDSNGKDEIIYGSCCIDDNGRGLWSTGLGHGDAMHVSDLNPDRPGLEVWGIHEGTDTPGSALLDGRTGQIIWQTANSDAGRGVAADVTASYRGAECWGGTSGLRTCTNASAGSSPPSTNFVTWWDGTLQRALLDGNTIRKYGGSTLLSASGCSSNNSTKSTPCLSADILGDWREEVVFRTSDNLSLRIYTTTTTTSHRLFTLMHDPQYRLAVAWQNVAYNQPPHPSFYLGDGTAAVPVPGIMLLGNDLGPILPNPMTWASAPAATGLYSISMTASPVTAGLLDAEYYFQCVSGGGHDSGWQAGRTYVDTGLDVNSTYGYLVKARDWADQSRETTPSGIASATTLAMPAPVAMEAYWPLNETSGLAFVDVSGNYNDGIVDGISGPDAAWEQGVYNNCLGFQIGGGRASVPTSETMNFGNESLSVAFWLKEPATIVTGTRHEILIKGTLGAPTDTGDGKRYEFYRQKDAAENDLFRWATSDGAAWSAVIINSGMVCTGEWVHVVGVRDKPNNQLRLYVNGILRGATFDSSGNIGNQSPLYVGGSGMIAAVDDVRIYRGALGLEEVTALYVGEWNVDNSPPTPSPMTFAVPPVAGGIDTVTMTATAARDISGVEYFFANVTDAGHDSGWQDAPVYTDTGLVNNTAYTYRVMARDKSIEQYETDWSEEAGATTLRYECTGSMATDFDGDCRTDMLDYAILAGKWTEPLPLTGDIAVNGAFETDITPGWEWLELPTAGGSCYAGFDGPPYGNPPGAAYLQCDMLTGDVYGGHFFYQVVPVTPGQQYRFSGEWSGDLVSSLSPNPLTISNHAEVVITFESGTDPAGWGWMDPNSVMYRKSWGMDSQNTQPEGTWDWESITASLANGPSDGIFTATAEYMVVAFTMGGITSPTIPWIDIDNIKVEGPGCPTFELVNDCSLDLLDLRLFAEEWLACDRVPTSECWQ